MQHNAASQLIPASAADLSGTYVASGRTVAGLLQIDTTGLMFPDRAMSPKRLE